MKAQRLAVAAVVLAAAIALFLVWRSGNTSPRVAGGSASDAPSSSSAAAPVPSGTGSVTTATTAAAELAVGEVRVLPGARELVQGFHDSSEPAAHDLEILQEALGRFRHVLGGNPPGGVNAEIVAGLTGANPKKLAVIPPDWAGLNAAGEVVDRWGQPFLFHPVSGESMEILSSGPDLTLWTDDDIGTLNPVSGPVGGRAE